MRPDHKLNRQTLVLVATILGSAVIFLDGTVVNLALPHIAADLHTGLQGQQWITDGYLVTLSSLVLLGGSLGDILGRKRIYLVGLAGFALASLVCAVAGDATTLIGARVVQGCFGALVVPGALSIINTNFEHGARGEAIGRWTAWTSAFFVVGPLVGGLILGLASWRWIFLINLPLVGACIALALPSIRESTERGARHIDYPGAALAALALGAASYGLIEGPAHHWAASDIVSLGAAVGLSALFIWWERHSAHPMLELGLFRSRNFAGANLMTVAMYGALGGFTFALTIYLQTRLHYSSLAAGLSLLPVSVVMFLFAGRTAALADRRGPRLFMTAGPLIAGVGIGSLFFLRAGDSYWLALLPGALLFSLGLVLTVAPLTATVMASVSDEHSGIASGINNALSRAAGLLVVALLGLLGSGAFYHFAIALCAGLALAAGMISYATIENPQR